MARITLRLDDEIYDFIKKTSAKNDVSVNSCILDILHQFKKYKENFEETKSEKIDSILSKVASLEKIATASILIGREILKESSKSGYFSENYILDEKTGGEDATSEMNSYITKKDNKTALILKDIGVL